jgi:hypothetical protein
MNTVKEKNFLNFLNGFHLSSRAALYLNELLDFNLNKLLPQRKLMELGQIISRVVAMNCVLKLSDRGFRPDLIAGALNMLKQEITSQICTYSYPQKTLLVEEYEENSSWLNYISEK